MEKKVWRGIKTPLSFISDLNCLSAAVPLNCFVIIHELNTWIGTSQDVETQRGIKNKNIHLVSHALKLYWQCHQHSTNTPYSVQFTETNSNQQGHILCSWNSQQSKNKALVFPNLKTITKDVGLSRFFLNKRNVFPILSSSDSVSDRGTFNHYLVYESTFLKSTYIYVKLL